MCMWMQNSLETVLAQTGIEHLWFDHAPAYSSASSLKVLNRWGSLVLKNLLVHLPTGPAIVVIPAHLRLNLEVLEKVAAGPVRLGTSQEAWLLFPDCEFGAVPPVGKQYKLPTLWDAKILEATKVVIRGNTSMRSCLISPRDLAGLDNPVVIDGLAQVDSRKLTRQSA